MINLLKEYSLIDVITIVIACGLGIKGFISYWDWAFSRIKQKFSKELKKEQQQDSIEARINKQHEEMHKLEENQQFLSQALDSLINKVDMLIESDRDDIKSFLTKEHHYFCYQQGWIDDYSLECCEKRFKHYQDEGGNSFIEQFMKELRSLPKSPNLIDS